MPSSDAVAPNAYSPPVSELLQLGEPHGKERQERRDYSALGISAESVPELIRMATDPALNDGPQDSKVVWAPVHAWRALGQLRATVAVVPLLDLLQRADESDDWIMSDLPEALAQIGAPAVGPVANYLADTTRGEWARVTAADALGHIGRTHPELRAECVTRLTAQLEKCDEQPEMVNTFVISSLWDLRAVEAMPVIERAFVSGRVDESVNGDLEDVQIHFGLKTKREHSRKPNSLTEMSRRLADMREENEAYEKENAELRSTLDALEKLEPPPGPYLAPPKIGRNDPCPCGSGKKYKKCCGA
ncbi:MAG TPA: DUF1186 domain-containing protein [Verrucomicrobiae bacterium]|nr:DUF1186 domain-containing protein [Verrucomicrobiae bacterium]